MVVLGRLSATDFASSEDRELFEDIRAAVADMPLANTGPALDVAEMPDATAEEIASDILDLRDTTMGRAIRNARMTAHPEPRRRARRDN